MGIGWIFMRQDTLGSIFPNVAKVSEFSLRQCGKRLLAKGEWKFQVASKIHFTLAGLASKNMKTLATITGYSFKIS